MPYALALAAAIAAGKRRSALLFPLVASGLTWLVMASTKDGGGSIHHTVLLYPLLHWLIAGAGSDFPRAGRFVLAATVLLAIDNARLVWLHRENGRRLGGGELWSEAIFDLATRVRERNPRVIRLADWGLQDNLILLTQRPLPVTSPRPPIEETVFSEPPDAIWIRPLDERIPGINDAFAGAAARYGYEKHVHDQICDRRGQTMYEIYEYRRIRR
jgi:hypothetical protein